MKSTGLIRIGRLGLVALASTWFRAAVQAQDTFRVSVDSTAAQADNDSFGNSIASDGRFVAISSLADDLVAGDTNQTVDVFVHDALTGTTERVSVDSSGVEGNGASANASISADGRYVAFNSWASNLTANSVAGAEHVFIRDRLTGATELVSVDSSGNLANSACATPTLSADGQVVAWVSDATNLVAGDTNGTWDVFVHDLATGVTERVSVSSSGQEGDASSYGLVSLSADGQIVEFNSSATNLVTGDTNGQPDVFVHDRSTGVTERISVDGGGQQGNDLSASSRATLSADGRIAAFQSLATNLVAGDSNGTSDIFVHDRATGTTERVSVDSSGGQGNGESDVPSLSSDGVRIAFQSLATNLVAGDTNGVFDVFVHDRSSGVTERASVDASGAQGDAYSGIALLSGDGESVAFTSHATNLVANDTNDRFDLFVHGACPTLASWSNYGAGFPGTNGIPAFTSRQDPVLGATITLDLANSSAGTTIGLVFVGFLHADLHSTWGGDLLVEPVQIVPMTLPSGGTTLTGTVPNDPSLCATAIDLQAVELDAGAAHGVSFTPGLALLLGN